MESKNGTPAQSIRTSDRLRKRPKYYNKGYFYYQSSIRKKVKSKKRTAASQIAKKILTRKPSGRTVSTDSINLRRSTRKRKVSINLEGYTDTSSSEDDDLMTPRFRTSKNKSVNNSNHELSPYRTRKTKRLPNSKIAPRREGLRPRRSPGGRLLRHYQESEDDEEEEEDDDDDDDDEEEEEGEGEGDTSDTDEKGAQKENGNGNEENGNEEEEEADGGDEAEEEEDDDEQEGRRRYDLRERSEVRRPSPEKGDKQRAPRSPRRVLHHGMGLAGPRNGRYLKKGGPRMHKRPRFALPDDSDDSLLVDEHDGGPTVPWSRGSARAGAPLFLGGMEMQGSSAWGLNLASSGWVHQGETSAVAAGLTPGVQTAGPSSKGGADIQPLQVDDNVSFNDIGGLSEYIDALKEMVFFPLLYPDFFANYHITPPRGVLLCGPPGTGKTLIARALACAASKAGQKVSIYMRKGADVLSKWVGEAERQLKLLFEEAQRNQPSIIFFDEIDGLAPVRSSKQEQIHNSIVSTLLALMDGLDSRGQVVLIGATNRIDAIDGALRRPGRFDREFHFPLPSYEARTEILDIHTRKWKDPPSDELKKELAASCVGYCGADLKALCTEAAIRAFREKYPQVYTSDDKFVIDVDSVQVEKYHFLEAMSTITPAAHRGSIVHSRPLSQVVGPCLKRHLEGVMDRISDVFPFINEDVSKYSLLSFGSAIPLVYRPRLLICGDDFGGLDHVGPAVLHELEKFPVHSVGLPSLLSDASAKTPEEALVHIFGEARRTTPSILYLPQFHLWWETAHEQLKAVLLTLLDDLPSNLPVLLLGTSTVSFEQLDEDCASIFTSRNTYQVDRPSKEDRSRFFDALLETVVSLQKEESKTKSKDPKTVTELPKVPKEVSGPKPAELKARAEAEQHAVRRLRMCLRDVCNRILYDKKFSMFHYPVAEEEAPDYRLVIPNPMDMATVLQRVDSGHYLTRCSFMKDIELIASNAKAYNGTERPEAYRIVSRACELRDVVEGMLSQMDPTLVSFCEKIAEQGGPLHFEEVDTAGSILQSNPVAQLAVITRTSARLRNVQPEVNLSQSYEVLKRQKRSTENEQLVMSGAAKDDKGPNTDPDLMRPDSTQAEPTEEPNSNGPENSLSIPEVSSSSLPGNGTKDVEMFEADFTDKLESIKQRFMELTEEYGVPQLEILYTKVIRGLISAKNREARQDSKQFTVRYLFRFVEEANNF
ncbi:ATPase family AAA domain-containing protein [Rhynchospora pubera]|uniref:ATPase family AAA domain-containing protein n=1 Tax=Rhynchospora pubera TaxID=906938 RepID=A0AAV8END2_9POAL|nr:ATPase family AAA domain-containing protein [Rhynchospora pubera]